ncbi:hypothetical protein BDW22DRAFT_371449 [Trametopsis cervina]|nr:hypothetical protein BDW22DRAFT_371449 [Trametopsis cervina]
MENASPAQCPQPAELHCITLQPDSSNRNRSQRAERTTARTHTPAPRIGLGRRAGRDELGKAVARAFVRDGTRQGGRPGLTHTRGGRRTEGGERRGLGLVLRSRREHEASRRKGSPSEKHDDLCVLVLTCTTRVSALSFLSLDVRLSVPVSGHSRWTRQRTGTGVRSSTRTGAANQTWRDYANTLAIHSASGQPMPTRAKIAQARGVGE